MNLCGLRLASFTSNSLVSLFFIELIHFAVLFSDIDRIVQQFPIISVVVSFRQLLNSLLSLRGKLLGLSFFYF